MERASRSSGFTIVELIIVITVIGILATIVTISYVGIQTTARSNSAAANAAVLQRKLEAYLSLTNAYPSGRDPATYMTQLNAYSDTSLAGSPITVGTPGPTNGTTTFEISQCISGNDGNHYRIRYWDFSKNALSDTDIEGTIGGAHCPQWTPIN